MSTAGNMSVPGLWSWQTSGQTWLRSALDRRKRLSTFSTLASASVPLTLIFFS